MVRRIIWGLGLLAAVLFTASTLVTYCGPSPLSLQVSTDKQKYIYGEPVMIHGVIKNNSTKMQELKFGTDFFEHIVLIENGTSHSYAFKFVNSYLPSGDYWMEPGKEIPFQFLLSDWNLFPAPGEHTIKFRLTTHPKLHTHLTFDVEKADPQQLQEKIIRTVNDLASNPLRFPTREDKDDLLKKWIESLPRFMSQAELDRIRQSMTPETRKNFEQCLEVPNIRD
jgi:hypothetical protein